MKRIAAHIDIAVSPQLVVRAIQATLTSDRLLDAYRGLRKGKEHSGFVTELVPSRRVVIAFAGLDPATNTRSHRFGWEVIYELDAAPDGRTRVTVAIEYSTLTAIAAAGLAKAQAENDIAHRLAALAMLEMGTAAMGGVGGEPEARALGEPAPDPAARSRAAAREATRARID